MRRRTRSAVLATALCAVAVTPASAGAAECRPRVSALPSLGGGEGEVMDFGPAGTAVGGALDAEGRFTAVLWRDGRIVDLGLPRGDSEAMDVNGSGTVVGSYDHSDDPGSQRAFAWRDGEFRTLPGLLPDGRGAGARRIDEHGTIVGSAIDALGRELPVRWRGGRLERLGPLPEPFEHGYALGISASGAISGGLYGDEPFGPPVPFLWQDGRFTILPALAGPASVEGPFGEANLIDDRGVAAGSSDDERGLPTATVWRDGAAHSLGLLADDGFSQILGANGLGDYTGWASGAEGEVHAFVSDGGPLRALTGLSGDPTQFSIAHAINARGDVGGISLDADETARPTVWRCALAHSATATAARRGATLRRARRGRTASRALYINGTAAFRRGWAGR